MRDIVSRMSDGDRADREARIQRHIRRYEAHQAMVEAILSRPPTGPIRQEEPSPRTPSCWRAVIEVDRHGNERRYDSVASAAAAMGVSPNTVSGCIRGRCWSQRARRWWYDAAQPRPAAPNHAKLQAVVHDGTRYDSIQDMVAISGLTRRQVEYRLARGISRRDGTCHARLRFAGVA